MEGTYLMISECQGSLCSYFDECEQTEGWRRPCPFRYAYWYENPNFDSPHNTHLTEEEARKDPEMAEWVEAADRY